MGKKATLLLTVTLLRLLSLIIAILAVVGWFAQMVSPGKSWFVSLMALVLMFLIVLNVLFFLFWAYKRSWWSLIPLCAVLLNYDYISSIVQIDLRSDDEILNTDLKVATYNIHGSNSKEFYLDLIDIMTYLNNEKVDVVCFQEFSDDSTKRIDPIFKVYPYNITFTANVKGMQLAIFSKYPLIDPKFIRFKETSNSAMLADVIYNSRPIRIFNIHFQTTNINQSKTEIAQVKDLGIENPIGKQAFDVVMQRVAGNASQRSEQVTAIRHRIDSILVDKPMIVCGDFNDTPSSYTYHQISKGMNDGFKTCGKGYAYTYKPLYKLFRIDYIFYSSVFKGVKYISPSKIWSDHNPVLLELNCRNRL
ncbi:MAG: endonuclease/exonuclease/phosphatase family protein [Rikenellaceae bacterium]